MSNLGPMSGQASSRVPTPPRGDTIARYDTYLEAQRAVDYLSDQQFPVQFVTIVGTGLRMVERVTGRLTYPRVAGASALSGLYFGFFVGLALSLFGGGNDFSIFAVALVGAGFGMLFGIISYALTGGRRDFTSTSQIVASEYEVLCMPEQAQRAQELLWRLPGGRGRDRSAGGHGSAAPGGPGGPGTGAAGPYPGGPQYPGGQSSGAHDPGAHFPGAHFPGAQYPGGQYPPGQYPGGQAGTGSGGYPPAGSPTAQFPPPSGSASAGAPPAGTSAPGAAGPEQPTQLTGPTYGEMIERQRREQRAREAAEREAAARLAAEREAAERQAQERLTTEPAGSSAAASEQSRTVADEEEAAARHAAAERAARDRVLRERGDGPPDPSAG